MASLELGKLIWRITGDTTAIKKSLAETEKATKKTSSKLDSIGKGLKFAAIAGGIAFVGKALFNIGKDAVKAASKLQETASKYDTIFGDLGKDATDAADLLQDSYGQSEESAKSMLAATGDLLVGMQFQKEAALEISLATQKLSIDLDSFQNLEGGATRASEALTAAYFGQFERLKALGIILSKGIITEELARQGKDKLTGAALNQAKAQIVLELATKQSTNAVGDFAKTSDSYANIQKRVNARLTDLKSDLGTPLLYSFSKLGKAFLESSKDGGVLLKGLKGIVKGIASVIDSITNIVNFLEEFNKKGKAEDAVEGARKLQSEYKAFKRIVLDSFGSIAKLNKKVAEGDRQAIFAKKELIRLLDRWREGNNSASKSSNEFTAAARRSLESLKEIPDLTDAITERERAREKQRKRISANTTKSNKKTEEELEAIKNGIGAVGAEAAGKGSQSLEEWSSKVNKVAQQVGSSITGILSGVGGLMSQLNQNALDDVDERMEKELAAAGLSSELTIANAEEELAAAQAQGDKNVILDKQQQLNRLKIIKKFEKEKRKLEYEGALANWQLQVATAFINIPLATSNALTSGSQINPIFGIVMASLAGISATLQLGAVIAARPSPPKFATGGIVPGTSTSGDNVSILANSGEGVFTQDQMKALSPVGKEAFRVVADRETAWQEIFDASKNGDLYIDKRAVVE